MNFFFKFEVSPKKVDLKRRFALIFLCLLYGYVMMINSYVDHIAYLRYAESSDLHFFFNYETGFFRFVFNEPLWLLINIGLGIFFEPEDVIRAISFFSSSLLAYSALRAYPRWWVVIILLLLLPQVIRYQVTGFRQGVAIALFVWAWFHLAGWKKLSVFVLLPFIHSSYFIILSLLALTWLLRSIRFAPDLKTVTYVVAGIAVGLGLGVSAELLGARQGAQYAFEPTDVSGLGFLLWVMILGIMLSAGKTWLRDHAFESGVVIFYLVTYWLIEVTARIFESGLVVVLLAGLSLRGWRRQAFLGIVLGAGALAWVLRIGRPALGFAGG